MPRQAFTRTSHNLEPALPLGLDSENIAHIFGAQTNAFELFVLKRKIMGPCWLRIERAERVSTGVVSPHCAGGACNHIINESSMLGVMVQGRIPRQGPETCQAVCRQQQSRTS